MSRGKSSLDVPAQLAELVARPKRVGLFGHRVVGKTTLLAVLYRQASSGQVRGLRLAAIDPATAEYLADKIDRLEAGESPPGTLVETELLLRLYRGPTRIDLVVKDYQGEDVALGARGSIGGFFAECDAVFLCLDPSGPDRPADRRRRQQEIEALLESYLEKSDSASAPQILGLLVTKYDRVLAEGGPEPDRVDELVEERFGMARHALRSHVAQSDVFAVSSFGLSAGRGESPPEHLSPMGLDRPFHWLIDQLEHLDVSRLERLIEIAPGQTALIQRALVAFEARYPDSDAAPRLRRRLARLKRSKLVRRILTTAGVLTLLAGSAVGYDLVDFKLSSRFEGSGRPASEVAARWERFERTHPILTHYWPAKAAEARNRARDWRLRATETEALAGTGSAESLRRTLQEIKDSAPDRAEDVAAVEQTLERRRHDETWSGLSAEIRLPDEAIHPEALLASVRQFLIDFPNTSHRSEAEKALTRLRVLVEERASRDERDQIDEIVRDAKLPEADLPDLAERCRSFLDRHPSSRYRSEVEELLANFAGTLDDRDFDRALRFERENPRKHVAQIERYRAYIRSHAQGGRHVKEATQAIERIDQERDRSTYAFAYDHWVQHPMDLEEVARRLRTYRETIPDGRFRADADRFLSWFEQVEKGADYRVTLVRGNVSPMVGKYLSGGGPNLSVTVWVGGRKYGPTPAIPDHRSPIWGYTFAEPIHWKLGDPVRIQLSDSDWSDSVVLDLTTPPDDKLAIRNLSGTVRPTKHPDLATLEFASTFRMPILRPPG